MINRKIYISAAAPGFSRADLNNLLAVSRRNNAAAGLTGLLIFHQGRFFQILEGARASVGACYARIERDTRHTGLVLVENGSAQARAFDRWKMGFAHPGSLDPKLRDSILSIYDLVPPDSEGRGTDRRTRVAVRDFLAQFQVLSRARG